MWRFKNKEWLLSDGQKKERERQRPVLCYRCYYSFSPTHVLASWGPRKEPLNSVVFGLRLASSAAIKIEFSHSPLHLNARTMAHKCGQGAADPPAQLLLVPPGPGINLLLQDTQRLQLSVRLGTLIVL